MLTDFRSEWIQIFLNCVRSNNVVQTTKNITFGTSIPLVHFVFNFAPIQIYSFTVSQSMRVILKLPVAVIDFKD
jgi:hypothetical protein